MVLAICADLASCHISRYAIVEHQPHYLPVVLNNRLAYIEFKRCKVAIEPQIKVQVKGLKQIIIRIMKVIHQTFLIVLIIR